MIFTQRQITVRKGVSIIDEPVILYRGDFEIELRFIIIETEYRFKNGVNLVDSEKAAHAQLALLAPDGTNVFTEIGTCEGDTVNFVLSKEMIDEIREVGKYSFQIRLFDYNQESRITIPPVEFGIEVREPVANEDHDNQVNVAMTGYSIAKVTDVQSGKSDSVFDINDEYNMTTWETGDRISENRLNKIEEAIYVINQNEKNDTEALNKQMLSNYNVLQTKIDALILESGTNDLEVVDARGNASTLRERLEEMDQVDDDIDDRLDNHEDMIDYSARRTRDNMTNLSEINKSGMVMYDVEEPIFTRDSVVEYEGVTYGVNEPRFCRYGLVLDTKLNEQLLIPTKNLFTPDEGTIEITIMPTVLENYTNICYMYLPIGRFVIYIDENGDVRFSIGESESSGVTKTEVAKVGRPLNITARWSKKYSKYDLIINNQYAGSHEYTYDGEFPNNMYLISKGECRFIDLKISNIYKTGLQVII